MLLVLEVGLIGVFLSLDLFLFFVFWEVMLMPMYFLIGIWGHDRRIYAAVKFILYTMFGSILMLVAIVWLYKLTGTFDLPGDSGASRIGPIARADVRARRTAALRRFLPGLRHQGAALPVPHLASGRAHRSAHGRLGDPGRRDAEARHLRHAALLPAALSGSGASPRALYRRAGHHRHHLWRAGSHGADRFEAPRRVHVGEPPGISSCWAFSPSAQFRFRARSIKC